MSYMKNRYCNHIYVAGGIENREIDDLYGTVLTVENKTVKIDDFIEMNDGGLMVCVIVTDSDRHETYVIMDDHDFRKIVLAADTVTLSDNLDFDFD